MVGGMIRWSVPILAVLLLEACARPGPVVEHGGIVRGDTTRREIALVFTGDHYADGGRTILETLRGRDAKAAFFFTGNFYRDERFAGLIRALRDDGHYLGAHSDRHLLYNAWENRDSTLVSADSFREDVLGNYREMARFGIRREDAPLFMPPYEWYNAEIAGWAGELGLQIVNFTPGTRTNADYTVPGEGYVPGDEIWRSVLEREAEGGLNGFILLLHIGTAPERTDKFYDQLGALIDLLRERRYVPMRIDDLLVRP